MGVGLTLNTSHKSAKILTHSLHSLYFVPVSLYPTDFSGKKCAVFCVSLQILFQTFSTPMKTWRVMHHLDAENTVGLRAKCPLLYDLKYHWIIPKKFSKVLQYQMLLKPVRLFLNC